MKNPFGAVSGVGSIIDSLFPTSTKISSTGSILGVGSDIELQVKYPVYTEEDIANRGRPCCKTLTLSACPGFVMCQNPNFTGAPTTDENNRINAYLESGAYIE